LGGLDATLHVLELCATAGVGALAGGMLETGIGRATLLAVAARPECTLTGDISASERYFGPDCDVTEPFVLVDGQLVVPDGPGLGVAPVPERLAACTIEHERIDRS
jgi:O-succinylbenzoate synthase